MNENRKTCARRELESLIGVLHLPLLGDIPAQRYKAATSSHTPQCRIQVQHNVVGCLQPIGIVQQSWHHQSSLHLTSDASDSWGCGAWHATHWLQLEQSLTTWDFNIAAKELLPIMNDCSSDLETPVAEGGG